MGFCVTASLRELRGLPGSISSCSALVLPADWTLCFRGEGRALPEAVSAMCVSQTPEAMGERCLGDSSRIPPDGEETWRWAVWRSVDG